ncbi:nucleoside-diphosphate kinase [Candidatus Uhrbacteria bacterium]|nr:nucleoside-diphosphate kinase [Candidatus Uhrbacteria bacterium]
MSKPERTLVLIKPDALQRNLLGEIVGRFERKGLKIIGMKMMQLGDLVVTEHYAHHQDKPFFGGLKAFMQSSPIVAIVLEGVEAISAVRLLVGPTKGSTADAGSIRGDLSMSTQANLVHASDSPEAAEKEVWRFFNTDEIFAYKKVDYEFIYGSDEK